MQKRLFSLAISVLMLLAVPMAAQADSVGFVPAYQATNEASMAMVPDKPALVAEATGESKAIDTEAALTASGGEPLMTPSGLRYPAILPNASGDVKVGGTSRLQLHLAERRRGGYSRNL